MTGSSQCSQRLLLYLLFFFYEGLGELFEARTARAVAAWVAMLLQPGRVDAEPGKEIGELSSIHCCCVE